jgi:ABC-type multidrug transport system ATPase subunit
MAQKHGSELAEVMDASVGRHPDTQTLLAYRRGRLDDQAGQSLREHVMKCADCRRKLDEMPLGRRPGDSSHEDDTAIDLRDNRSPAPSQSSGGVEQTLLSNLRNTALLRGTEVTERFEVEGWGVIGRDFQVAQYLLEHPHVSRLHASLAVVGKQVVITDLGSSNGTYVNGRRIHRPVELAPGDRIDIGPFSLHFDGSALVSRSRSNNIELAARGLSRVVRDRASGRPISLLSEIDLVVLPHEFVCLLGPSGSGKTTLLSILSGRNPPTEGDVTVNGQDLYANFEALKEDLAVVPQKDVLHDSLAVASALRYTAELRLPPDLSKREVEASVDDILGVVGLTSRKGTLIRHLSGGQLKRASLANEMVSKPSLLFLDEVTSGLDEQTDLEVMELFRQVADGGKTVVCVTHSLANVESTCHLVVILTEGGRLAFIGTPEEAKAYFGISRLGEVYRKLAGRPAAEWSERFRASPFFERYVVERLPSEADRVPLPKLSLPPSRRRKRRGVRQAWVLTRRYVDVWRGDHQALLALFGQCLLIAIALGLVFGRLGDESNPAKRVQKTVNLLMLLAVPCFWFGCNTGAKELVKERIIFLRERDFNLRVGGYFLSKFVVLVVAGLVQVTILFGIVWFWCKPPGPPGEKWLVLAALAMTGTLVGLMISAVARTEEVATALVPVAVLPQIIMAGVVVPLTGLGLKFSKCLITVYWGQEALERTLPRADLEILKRHLEDTSPALTIILVHALVAALTTVVVLHLTGRKSRR